MKTAVLRWLTLLDVVVTLVVAVIAGIKVNHQNVSYEEVEAKIISTDKKRVKKTYHHDVVVEYKGKNYKLLNVRGEEFSRYEIYKGSYITVYFANEKMYSNITGIKTDGTIFHIYLGALGSMIVFLGLHIRLVKDAVKALRK